MMRKLAVALLTAAGLATAVPSAPAMAGEGFINLPLPTLGGKQLWRDVFLHAEWRIQENVLTGLFRLLDPKDHRQAWGRYLDCLRHFETVQQERSLRPRSPHLVLLVHGIARSTGTFSELKPALQAAGYDAVAISYPSTRDSIERHAEGLSLLLDRLQGTSRVSFVTHSMGGLVVRQLLSRERDWMRRVAVGSVVMVAPPNQGSAVARLLKDLPAYRLLYGESGQELVPEAVLQMPVPHGIPIGVIAGGKGDGEGYNPFLAGDDDGTVKVAETLLPGAQGPIVVSAVHATISNHPTTIAATLRFLNHDPFKSDYTLVDDTH